MKKYAKNSNYNTKIILTFMLKNVNNENNGNNNYDNVYILLKIAIKKVMSKITYVLLMTLFYNKQ